MVNKNSAEKLKKAEELVIKLKAQIEAEKNDKQKDNLQQDMSDKALIIFLIIAIITGLMAFGGLASEYIGSKINDSYNRGSQDIINKLNNEVEIQFNRFCYNNENNLITFHTKDETIFAYLNKSDCKKELNPFDSCLSKLKTVDEDKR